MNRRHVWALVAVGAVLAGCGSGVAATTTPAPPAGTTASSGLVPSSSVAGTSTAATLPAGSSPAAGSAAAGSAAAGSATASTLPTGQPSTAAGETTSTVIPAVLDSQSAAWFGAVCEALDADMPTGDGDLLPQVGIDYVQRTSAAMIATGQIAKTLPPPTIDGGAELATALSASMSSSGADLAARLESYVTEMGVNAYSVKSALAAQQLTLIHGFEPLGGVDPAVHKALHQFPGCAIYGF